MNLGFGEAGCWTSGTWSTAGSGGTAGKGGVVEYSKEATINAYNGNRITEDDFNYSTVCYEYDKNGELLDEASGTPQIAKVVSFINDSNKKIIPAKIFIQDGIRRAVYDNLCYMPEERKKQYGVNGDVSSEKVKNTSNNKLVKNVRIIDENLDIEHSRQGIGSGAGYIELDNGTFEELKSIP